MQNSKQSTQLKKGSRAVAHSNNSTSKGASLAPPPFQLKASGGQGAKTTAASAAPVQMKSKGVVQAFTLNPIALGQQLGGQLADWRERHYNRNQHNQLPATEPSGDANDPNWERLSDLKSIYHQNGEEGRGNRKYVSRNGGHHEAVFDSNGNPVTDSANLGTYNFTGPDDAWGHFKDDVLPYWLWGNSPDDDTPLINRIAGPRIMERAGNWIGDKARGARDWIGDKASDAWSGAKSLGRSAVSGARRAGSWAADKASDAWSGAKSLGRSAVSGARRAGSWAAGKASDAWSGAKRLGSSAVSGAKRLGSSAVSGAKKAGNWAASKASSAWSGAKSGLKKLKFW